MILSSLEFDINGFYSNTVADFLSETWLLRTDTEITFCSERGVFDESENLSDTA